MSASARGLFRATGKASQPVAIRHADGSYGKAAALERNADDFYPTPVEPIRALLHRERVALSRYPTIWEPACGDGAMVREIERRGFACIGSDVVDRGCGAVIEDFFFVTKPYSPAIITNPPYNRVNSRDGDGEWIWHALDTLKVDYMALLLNWSWPGAAGLGNLWLEHPPSIAYLMRWKIDFTGQGAPPMLNGWFVWDRFRPAINGNPALGVMDRIDPNQGQLFGAAEQ